MQQIQVLNNLTAGQSDKVPKALLSVNQYTDWSLPQYNSLLTFVPSQAPQYASLLATYKANQAANVTSPATPVPSVTSIDWVASGVAWPTAYDQFTCGGGYAFAAVGALQAAYEQKYSSAKHLSVTQVLTCSSISGNAGCLGGNPEATFNYWKTNPAELSTTFNTTNSCSVSAANGVVETTGFEYVPINNPAAMLAKLQQGPLAVGIAASQFTFEFYSSGIISPLSCGTKINHVVLLVGMGTDSNNVPYWVIQNSFGTTWGQAGYARIFRDMTPNSVGACGINQYVIRPLI